MGTVWIQIGLHTMVTLLALFAIGLRLEHRLTKIETDVSWLKDKMNGGGHGCQGQNCETDLESGKE